MSWVRTLDNFCQDVWETVRTWDLLSGCLSFCKELCHILFYKFVWKITYFSFYWKTPGIFICCCYFPKYLLKMSFFQKTLGIFCCFHAPKFSKKISNFGDYSEAFRECSLSPSLSSPNYDVIFNAHAFCIFELKLYFCPHISPKVRRKFFA
jgi:hypothetical protein